MTDASTPPYSTLHTASTNLSPQAMGGGLIRRLVNQETNALELCCSTFAAALLLVILLGIVNVMRHQAE